MKRLISLYPERWRERYRAEIEALIADRTFDLRVALDLLKGALDAHVHPELVRSGLLLSAAGADRVFVPGMGFRAAEGGLTLKQPVEVRRGEVSLWLGRIVSAERTDVDFAFSPIDALLAPQPSPTPWIGWTVELRDSTGRVYRAGGRGAGGTLGRVSIRATFEPIAPEIRHAELRVDGPFGRWEIPFDLVPLAESEAPHAITPDASAHDQGITLTATAFARAADYTALRLAAIAGPPVRFVRAIAVGTRLPGAFAIRAEPIELSDDRGNRYGLRSQVSTAWPEPGAYQETLLFGPLAADAQLVTVTVEYILVELSAEPCRITYPPGTGDYLFGGFPMRIRSATPDRMPDQYLSLEVETSEAADGRRLSHPGRVDVDEADGGFRIQQVRTTPNLRVIQLGVRHPGDEPFTITFRNPVVDVPGRWAVSFAV
ncbi:MAG: hypothetical protein E6I87_04800 [Chloroflexi bacterium]|nr:MAG: hypothetical protein E6I87_04800 [Chloroflexota bacterium]